MLTELEEWATTEIGHMTIDNTSGTSMWETFITNVKEVGYKYYGKGEKVTDDRRAVRIQRDALLSAIYLEIYFCDLPIKKRLRSYNFS